MSGELVTKAEQDMAKAMRQELAATKLEIVLAPAPEPRHHGHRIRTVNIANPGWYSDFCGTVASRRRDAARWRKHKTAIRRRNTLRALDRIARGDLGSLYAKRLLDYVRAELRAEAARFEAERAAYEARTRRPRARSYVREDQHAGARS